MGELLFGAGGGVNELAYVRLSAGVGLGIIIGGRLFRGASGVAGELGHTTVVEDGELGERAEVLGAAAIQLARAPQALTSRFFGSAAAA